MRARQRSQLDRARQWVGRAFLALFVALVGLAVVGVAVGEYQIRPVLSGSMRPGLPVGGVVVTERIPLSELQARDVLLFHPPDKPDEFTVHRVVELTPSEAGPVIRTQGDANDAPDPWTLTLQGTTAHRAVLSLPWVGYVAVWVHGPLGRNLTMAAGALMVLLSVARGFSRARRARPGESPPALDPVPPGHEPESRSDEPPAGSRPGAPGVSASALVAAKGDVEAPGGSIRTRDRVSASLGGGRTRGGAHRGGRAD